MPGQTKTPQRRLSAAQRRERILDAATEVFAEHGYVDASMGEIATRAGVVASVIYDHFPSKRALHIELLNIHGEDLIERSIHQVGGRNPEELQRSSIEAFFRLVEEDPFAWRFLFRDPPGDPQIAAVHSAIHGRATSGIAELIGVWAPPNLTFGGLSREQALWMLAKTTQDGTNGLARWWWEHPEVRREQVVELAHELLWKGFSGLLAELGRD
jgi:AcrR family transcriptional regulator